MAETRSKVGSATVTFVGQRMGRREHHDVGLVEHGVDVVASSGEDGLPST
jgi:hypothetical protein